MTSRCCCGAEIEGRQLWVWVRTSFCLCGQYFVLYGGCEDIFGLPWELQMAVWWFRLGFSVQGRVRVGKGMHYYMSVRALTTIKSSLCVHVFCPSVSALYVSVVWTGLQINTVGVCLYLQMCEQLGVNLQSPCYYEHLVWLLFFLLTFPSVLFLCEPHYSVCIHIYDSLFFIQLIHTTENLYLLSV